MIDVLPIGGYLSSVPGHVSGSPEHVAQGVGDARPRGPVRLPQLMVLLTHVVVELQPRPDGLQGKQEAVQRHCGCTLTTTRSSAETLWVHAHHLKTRSSAETLWVQMDCKENKKQCRDTVGADGL